MSSSLKSYEYLRLMKPHYCDMVTFHFKQLFRQIARRMRVKPSIHTPYKIEVKTVIHCHIFNAWINALKECKTWVGLVVDLSKDNKLKIIRFLNREVLNYHVAKALDNKAILQPCFGKRVGRCNLDMIISIDEPLSFVYNSKNCVLTATCKYEVKNWCGNIVSP